MMTLQTTTRETVERPGAAGPEDAKVPRYRSFLGALILVLAVAAALAAGGWGVVSSVAGEAPPARLGEDVAFSGGTLRVDKVTPEHMAPMQMGKFAKQGMNMSMPKMDMAPKGFERFTVDLTLVSQSGLRYAPEDFRISGEGVKDPEPIRSQLGTGSVPGGNAVSGSLVFQAPEKARDLTLQFDGSRPVALNVPAGKEGKGHGH